MTLVRHVKMNKTKSERKSEERKNGLPSEAGIPKLAFSNTVFQNSHYSAQKLFNNSRQRLPRLAELLSYNLSNVLNIK